ncbi:retrovirus-related pol polyprotein from transposon TNT 1-94 [Tanacetum coccineum]|uniref:Retrovirus-related pol polyprotein from transposon TNT 1-94 n=1 Tax=Tanacetum coccineum TaxID=301880 RepID=A0ABQ4ZEL2_9ASTR
MYAKVFRIDVPLTQSQPTESTHGTHRTTSAPRSTNLDKKAAESSALRSIKLLFHLRLSERRSTRLTPPACRRTVYVAEGLILERQKAKEETERLIAKAILQERGNIQAQILTQIENAIANVIPSQVDASMKFERNTVLQTACRTPVVRPRDQDDPHDDAPPEGEKNAKRQKTSEYEAYVSGEPSSEQVFQEEQAPSTSRNQEQDDDFDFWTDPYALDDDEIPTKQVSQDIMEEVSLTIYEAKLRKMADEMLRRRCTSGNEHQKDNMYSFDIKNIVPKERFTCLVAKATSDESMLWHRRLCHINFKNINKLVKDNLVRGLPTKRFENDQTCVACLKGKQHRASCKSKV